MDEDIVAAFPILAQLHARRPPARAPKKAALDRLRRFNAAGKGVLSGTSSAPTTTPAAKSPDAIIEVRSEAAP